MARKGRARSLCARELCRSRCFMAGGMSDRAAPAPRTWRVSSGWEKRPRLHIAGFADGSVAQLAALRDRLENTVLETMELVAVNGGGAARTPNTSNISFDCIEGEAMVIALDLKGLSVSTGAACSSGAIEPSHVLTAMGLSAERARGSIRFSLGKQNTAEEVEFALELIPQVVGRLREISPVYKKPAVSPQPSALR